MAEPKRRKQEEEVSMLRELQISGLKSLCTTRLKSPEQNNPTLLLKAMNKELRAGLNWTGAGTNHLGTKISSLLHLTLAAQYNLG